MQITIVTSFIGTVHYDVVIGVTKL